MKTIPFPSWQSGSLDRIAATVINRIENPALSARSRDRAVEFARDTSGSGARIVKPKTARDKSPGRLWATLSPEDRADIGQACALVLHRNGLLSVAESCTLDNHAREFRITLGSIPESVWPDLFSAARQACRIDRKYERRAERLDPLHLANIGDHADDFTGPDRAGVARVARIYGAALRAARDADPSRKSGHSFKRWHSFLLRAVAVINGKGHGMNATGKTARAMDKARFRDYLRAGLRAMETGSPLDLSTLPAFVF